MPKFKEAVVDFLDKPRIASYGMPEMREIGKIVKADIFKGESWAIKTYQHDDGIEVAVRVLHALLKRDDPTLTIEAIENEIIPDVPTIEKILDVFFRLEMDKTFEQLKAEGAKAAEKTESPLSPTPILEPTAS